MWLERGRTKKLVVAFHFLRAEQSRWKCDECRKQGLEQRRRCGFLPVEQRGPARLVWVRGQTGTQECPRSLMSPESVQIVEEFFVWKASGGGKWDELTARQADGFQQLEQEWRAEAVNGEPNSRTERER